MFGYIYFCFSAFLMISANNVPIQTYNLYQQNGFMNSPVNQPMNIQSFTPSVPIQNHLQQLNISPSAIKQSILNKLLEGYTAQRVLSSNTESSGLNLSNIANNQIPNNFVNNNVIIPAHSKNNQFLKDSKNRERPNQTNKKKLKSKRSQNDAEIIEDEFQKHTSANKRRTKNTETMKDINKNNKKSNQNKKNELKNTNFVNNGNNKKKITRTTSRKFKEQTTESPVVKNTEQDASPEQRQRKTKVIENNTQREMKSRLNKKLKNRERVNQDMDTSAEGTDVENRKTRNSKHEVSENLKFLPNTPQEMTNHFLTNLKQLDNPLMSNWIAHYENLYQSFLPNQPTIVTEKAPKRRKKKKNRNNKKKKPIQNINSTLSTTTLKPDKFDSEFITKELFANPIVESFKSFDTNNRNMKYSSNEIFRDSFDLNEYEEDNDDPKYKEGYIDDYYPLFTDSAAYTANNKEVIFKNLNENKYFYATEIETSIPHKYPKSSHDCSGRSSNDHEKYKCTYDEIEKESIRNAYKKSFDIQIEDGMHFRSPPFLEAPDFETRQIDKSKIPTNHLLDDKIRYVGDKSFSAKTANFHGSGIKTQPKDIETVFAKSKVVAYGPLYIPEENTLTPGSNVNQMRDHSFTRNSHQNNGTTYIVAKSVNEI